MKKEIVSIMPYFENFLVLFKGEKKSVFVSPEKLKGMVLEGEMVKKKTRTWFE